MMLPTETIAKIAELCEDTRTDPQYLTFHTIMEAIDLTNRWVNAHR